MAFDLEHFRKRERKEPDWIIPNWLKRQNTGFIIGEPKKACKSWLLLNLAICLGERKPIWGIEYSDGTPVFMPLRPMRTVYFTQEDTEDDIDDRVKILFGSGLESNDMVWIVPKDLGIRFDSDTGIAKMFAELDLVKKTGPIDLVIFDPMRRLYYGNENDSQVIATMWRSLDMIHKAYDCSTMFSHHIIKPPKDPRSMFDITSPFVARGSGDIYGGGDAFINVVPGKKRGRKTKGRLVDLHFESKRAAPVDPVQLKVDFTTGLATFEKFIAGRPGDSEEDETEKKFSRFTM